MIDEELLKNLTDEQKKALLEQLMSSLSSTEKEEKQEQTVSNNNISEDFRVTKTKPELERGRTPVRAKKNRWQDTGEFQLEGEEEWSSGRKRTARTRSKAKKVEIECSVCGKTFLENPNLIYGEYHRCNRCGRR
jgi:DNA-directed RNA polymerase subunit RPC12/RpoP|tara:strand:+ start:1024 stop:1425 length:402 start_codon:yes stop_codon:yes gene_type:complete